MSRKQLTLLVIGTVVLAAAILGVASAGRNSGNSMAECPHVGSSHTVLIKSSHVAPSTITAKRCDTLTIKNLDSTVREIGFGPHEHHQPYDGVTDKVLRQNQSLTITLVQTGMFHYHDHFHDEVAGSFTVSP